MGLFTLQICKKNKCRALVKYKIAALELILECVCVWEGHIHPKWHLTVPNTVWVVLLQWAGLLSNCGLFFHSCFFSVKLVTQHLNPFVQPTFTSFHTQCSALNCSSPFYPLIHITPNLTSKKNHVWCMNWVPVFTDLVDNSFQAL